MSGVREPVIVGGIIRCGVDGELDIGDILSDQLLLQSRAYITIILWLSDGEWADPGQVVPKSGNLCLCTETLTLRSSCVPAIYKQES